jgi:hypothetical protein
MLDSGMVDDDREAAMVFNLGMDIAGACVNHIETATRDAAKLTPKQKALVEFSAVALLKNMMGHKLTELIEKYGDKRAGH